MRDWKKKKGVNNMSNLEKRVVNLERTRGMTFPGVFLPIAFVNPDGSEALTAEEAAILDEAQRKITVPPGKVEVFLRTPEKAQELLTEKGRDV